MAETSHDGFLPIIPAAQSTERLELGTSIAIAFARTPMTVAIPANDLQIATKGRFLLGLGSQIKPHIERRFSMPWSHPAPRMREFVLAMRAIWAAWNDGTRLNFRGDFYTHTLMTPFFDPGPNEYGNPPVILAAVGAKMTEVAGEVCDGMFLHPFTTERYVREVTMPALERGFATAGRRATASRSAARCSSSPAPPRKRRRRRPPPRSNSSRSTGPLPRTAPVLELHGWGEIGDELNTMSKRGEWVEMGELFTDEMLQTFAVVADPDDVAGMLRARFGAARRPDRLRPPVPAPIPTLLKTIIAKLKD